MRTESDPHCILCDRPTRGEDFVMPAAILGSDPAAPEPVCVTCAALTPEERRPLREHAQIRLLRAKRQ